MSLNKVMLIGHLGDRSVLGEQDGGSTSVGLSVVTRMSHWFDVESGEERHGDEWHRVVVVHPALVDIARSDLCEDDQIYVEGHLQTHWWQDETFEWRSLTRIVLSRESDKLERLGDRSAGADEISGPFDKRRDADERQAAIGMRGHGHV